MRSTIGVLLLFLTVAATGRAATDPQDFAGSWKPPSTTGSYYRITNVDEGEQFVGRVTDGSASVGLCEGAPNGAEPPFWTAKQEGSLNGGGTYDGRTYIFRKDAEGDCSAVFARAKFWPLVADRLRICPAPFDAPDSEPVLDTTSPVDESETCTDFLRTEDPVEPQDHVAKDYIGKILRDDNDCPTDYNITLRYVADDPMNQVKVYGNRGNGFKRLPNNPYYLPIKTDAGRKRILDLRLVKKSAITIKVKIRTQSGERFTRKKHFGPC